MKQSGNTCNSRISRCTLVTYNTSCTYCSAKFSSVIQHETEKFGGLLGTEYRGQTITDRKDGEISLRWDDLHSSGTIHITCIEVIFIPTRFGMFLMG